MAWPLEAFLLLVAGAACVAGTAAIQAGWRTGSPALTVAGGAVIASLAAEVAGLNGAFGPVLPGGVATLSVIIGGVAVAAFAVYLVLPPPEVAARAVAVPTGPAANPDSEA